MLVVGIVEGFEIFEGGVGGVGTADVAGYGDEFLLSGEGGDDELRYLRDMGGAANNVDGLMFEELRAESLGHATDDGDDEVGAGFFCVFEVAEVGKHPLFGMVADGAGVDDNDVGGSVVVAESEACVLEGGGDEGGVELVHLAAEVFYVHFCGIHRIRPV